jgi:carboxyl-terminal processing protease
MIIILAPIDGSPADRAGLLAGDQILQVDDHKVTNDTALDMVVARVK